MDFNADPTSVFVPTKLVYVARLQLIRVSLGSVVALLRHWFCLCSFWPLILHCRGKFKKCHDNIAAFMFPFFVVSLSQQYLLAFFLSDCRDKLFKFRDKV